MLSRIWIGGLLLVSACVTFENVKATAKLGSALGDQPVVVSEWIAECEASHARKDDANLEKICLNPDKRYENMVIAVRDASALLQDYATALQHAADDKDVTVASDATAVLGQLGKLNTHAVKAFAPTIYNLAEVAAKDPTLLAKLTPSGIVTIVDTLTRFASQSYRRAGIATAVTTAAPHVDTLAAFVQAEAELHVEDIATLRALMADEVTTRPRRAAGQLLPLGTVWLDERIASLTQLVAACQAFRDAHNKLADRIQHDRPWRNSEMLAEIKADVEAIVAAAQGTASSSAATSATTALSTTTNP